jgi:hypothetical protein
MPDLDAFIMMGVGGFFLLLSIVSFAWASREERNLTDALLQRSDLKEFVNGWPIRIGPDSIRIGGRIFLILGTVVLILGIVFLTID